MVRAVWGRALKNGIDPRKFAEHVKAAGPDERRELVSRYERWVFAGARAQGRLNQFGVAILGVAVFAIFLLAVEHVGSWISYAVSMIGVGIGLPLAVRASRRERDWRRANPFDTWRP
jgi:hypothetical protein